MDESSTKLIFLTGLLGSVHFEHEIKQDDGITSGLDNANCWGIKSCFELMRKIMPTSEQSWAWPILPVSPQRITALISSIAPYLRTDQRQPTQTSAHSWSRAGIEVHDRTRTEPVARGGRLKGQTLTSKFGNLSSINGELRHRWKGHPRRSTMANK